MTFWTAVGIAILVALAATAIIGLYHCKKWLEESDEMLQKALDHYDESQRTENRCKQHLRGAAELFAAAESMCAGVKSDTECPNCDAELQVFTDCGKIVAVIHSREADDEHVD